MNLTEEIHNFLGILCDCVRPISVISILSNFFFLNNSDESLKFGAVVSTQYLKSDEVA